MGAKSVTEAYGFNRADRAHLPGGSVSGTALSRPDFPELLEWPYLWQQTEYVLGGGTTDFTLIRARAASSHDNSSSYNTSPTRERADSLLSLHRVAVGQHLILGGDNIDLALARVAEDKRAESHTRVEGEGDRKWRKLRGTHGKKRTADARNNTQLRRPAAGRCSE